MAYFFCSNLAIQQLSSVFSQKFHFDMEVLCGIFLTGLNPSIIGGFSGLCASMGVAATFLSAYLVRRLGILKVASYICLSPYQITRISGSGCNSYRYVSLHITRLEQLD